MPPSSQPKPEESEEEGEDAQEEEIENGEEDDDDFEGFDIDPSQKEFMKELLAIAPEEEVELLSPPPSPNGKHFTNPSQKTVNEKEV